MVNELYELSRKILYKELSPIWNALSSVKYAIVKGEALSQQIYGDCIKRHSSDIDILISKSDVMFLEKLLQKSGFYQQKADDKVTTRRNRVLCLAYSHQIPSYHKYIFNLHLNVDINYDVFWGEYEGVKCSIENFLSDVVETDIFGYKVKVLTDEKAFVQLLLHHYKEMNSLYHLSHYNCIRTNMFQDINDMINLRQDVLNLASLKKLSEDYSISSIMYYMLFYTNKVFPGLLLENYLAAFEQERDETIMDSYGLNSSERKRWKLSFLDRLDNDELKEHIIKDMTTADLKKIELNDIVFT